jgi:threonine 3-dehydrogenase
MKAICKSSPKPGAEYTNLDVPVIGKDELLLKVDHASICESDLAIYNWAGWAPGRIKTPLVFGHELCGEVVEMGQLDKGFNKGDFVSVESRIFCGLCYQCRNDQRHVCANVRMIGLDTYGGFAEYAAVPARCAWKHTDESLKDIGAIMEPFGNAVYGVLAEDIVGRTILISGCGPQGLFAIGIARAGGVKHIIALDSSPYRQKLAKKAGADHVLDPRAKDILTKIKHAAKSPDGVDTVIEMSGNPATIGLSLSVLRYGGRFTAFGLPGKKIELDYANDIISKGVRLYGVAGREIFASWYKMESILKSGAVNPRPMITHTFKFRDFKKAFELVGSKDKKCGKVILVP